MLEVLEVIVRQEKIKTIEYYKNDLLQSWYSLPSKGLIDDILLDINNHNNGELPISIERKTTNMHIMLFDNYDNIVKEYIIRFKDCITHNQLLQR